MGAGTSTAGRWTIILLIYFFILISVVTYASNLDTNISYSGGNVPTDEKTFRCDTPRTMYDFEFKDIRNPYPNSKQCEVTRGTYSLEACTSIQGCIWDNVTTGWWFWEDTTETCTGDINTSYYNNGTSTNNVCQMSELTIDDCILLGCTIYNDAESEVDSIKSAFDTISDMATFNTDIGLPAGYNYLFNFIAFYVMGIALIIAIAMYFRG